MAQRGLDEVSVAQSDTEEQQKDRSINNDCICDASGETLEGASARNPVSRQLTGIAVDVRRTWEKQMPC